MFIYFTEWDNLLKLVEKAKAVLDKEGVPRFLSKLFVNLEDFLNQTDADKEKKSKMSKPNAKGFNYMKSKMKKWTKANAKIDAAMLQYRNVRRNNL
jgi:translation initiation factor 3 subunit C